MSWRVSCSECRIIGDSPAQDRVHTLRASNVSQITKVPKRRHSKRRRVPAAVLALFLLGATLGGARFFGRDEHPSLRVSEDAKSAAPALVAPRGETTAKERVADIPIVPAPARDDKNAPMAAQFLEPRLPIPVPAPAPPAAYRDLLIDPNVGEDPPITATFLADGGSGLPGSASIEYRLFDQETRDSTVRSFTEHGVGVSLKQETASLGRFELHGAFTESSVGGTNASTSEGGDVVLLAQRDFALTDSLLMDNEAGHLRARVPQLLAQGYRVRLPEPLIEGVSSETRSADTAIRVTHGTLGTFRGRTFPVFTTDFSSGEVTGAAAGARLGQSVDVAAQFWQASEVAASDGVRSFNSAAGAIRYDGGDAGKVQGNVLQDDDGAVGVWLDGATRFSGWQHLAGVYRMDPDLDWVDRNSAVLTDTQGLYWQGTRRSFRTSTMLGLDLLKTNVDDDPSVSTREASSVFGSYGYRASPTLDLNGHLSLGTESTRGAGAAATDDDLLTARGTINRRHTSGRSTATVGVSDRSGSNPYRRIDANWDYYWDPLGRFNGLRAGIAQVHQSGEWNDFDETSLRLAGGWTGGRISAGVNANLGYLRGESDSQTTSLVFSLGWQLTPAWQLTGNLAYNENVLDLIDGDEARVSDRQLFLSLRYVMSWGRSERLVGAVNGKYGRGSVRGVLFLDKNGNGVRDADEPGVPSVTVYLDNGFATETGVNGEFAFTPVASGDHQVHINVANVPLPWGLNDERPLTVMVRPRETAIVEVPLVTQRPE